MVPQESTQTQEDRKVTTQIGPFMVTRVIPTQEEADAMIVRVAPEIAEMLQAAHVGKEQEQEEEAA